MVEVAVIGAGPYGLSVAAHLRGLRVPVRVFGKPMSFWQDHTPKGLTLKSDAFASNLSAPGDAFPLERFYRETGRADYSPLGLRVPAEVLTAYGREFQRRYVGEVNEAQVVKLARSGGGFTLLLETGEEVAARKVIVAAGLLALRHIPDSFSALPASMLSHSADHHDLSRFRGRRVIVVGAGQSACETAALLNEQGAEVCLLTRRKLIWFDPAQEDKLDARRSLWRRVRRPNFGLGPGWRTWFWSEMPQWFAHLPREMRHEKAYTLFGPAGSGWIKHRVDGVVPVHTGALREVAARGDEVRISVDTAEGSVSLAADHVIAATGYCADFRRFSFLDTVAREIQSVGGIPVLNHAFESSVPGLHFLGYLSAPTFGPSMRFIYGTRFAARRVSRHLSYLGEGKKRAGQFPVPRAVRAGAAT
ncbi:MAG TPA: NAD(P)-binding domain-containing protein [Acetobacteraceae bacterium]|nr:NAD(P)-binding domain-containing protein [Acetobacteraceae bacterium]